MSHKVFFPYISVLSLSLYFIVVSVIFKTVFVEGGIMIKKRGKPPSNSIKNYCILSEKESDDNSLESTSLKVNCSKIPGPLIKLDVGEDNYLKLQSNLYIAPGGYCALPGNPKYGKLCQTHSDPLWHKCCPENEVLDASTFKCRRSRIKFRPKVGKSAPQSFVIPKNITEKRSNGFKLQCASGFVSKVYSSNPCLPESSGIFQLAPNGTPMYEISMGVFLRKKQLKSIDHDNYCVDGILDFASSPCANFGDDGYHVTGGNREEDFNYKNDGNCRDTDMGEVLLVCMEEQDTILNEDGDDDVPKAYFFAGIWLSTCPFLLTAAIVNSCVIQKNVHGWILTCYLISMFLVNINSVVLILDIHIPISSLSEPNSVSTETGCGLLDFTMKFIYFSSLCWMSSMCMNMMQTFSSTIPQVVVEPHRFLISAIFSLGFPIIPVSVSYYVGSLPDDKSLFEGLHRSDNSTTSPASQQQQQQQLTCQRGTCALYSYKTLPYYSGPIIFLVLCNVVAFLKTSTTIASLRKQAEAVLHKQTRDHLESFALFAKLFLLTGSIWVIRVVLLVLQIQSLYVTWYGVALETVFSIPEVVFPMIIFHHPEFIKWAWNKSPMISRLIIKCSPFCKKDLRFKDQVNTPELQSVNQMSSVSQQNCSSRHVSKSTNSHIHNDEDDDQAARNSDVIKATTNGMAGYGGIEPEMESTSV